MAYVRHLSKSDFYFVKPSAAHGQIAHCAVHSILSLSLTNAWKKYKMLYCSAGHLCRCCIRGESEESIAPRQWKTRAHKQRIHPGSKTQGRSYQKSKTWGIRGRTKRTYVIQNVFEKNLFYRSISLANWLINFSRVHHPSFASRHQFLCQSVFIWICRIALMWHDL